MKRNESPQVEVLRLDLDYTKGTLSFETGKLIFLLGLGASLIIGSPSFFIIDASLTRFMVVAGTICTLLGFKVLHKMYKINNVYRDQYGKLRLLLENKKP